MKLNEIYTENCLLTMGKMPDNFIDLTVTSPPYDNLRNYKGYSFDFESIARELFRVTKKGGILVWIVGDAVVNGSETGTSFKQALFFKEIGFNIHDTMIYAKDSISFPETNRYSQIFEYMFIFSKGKPVTVNIIKDRKNINFKNKKITGRERQHDGTLSGRRKGNHLKEFGSRFNIWTFNTGFNKSSKDKIAFKHPAIFPEKLVSDHIKSWSNSGDLIYDCFGGSGTTAKISHLLGRNWIISEISAEYVNEITIPRLTQYLNQTKLFKWPNTS